MLLFREAQVFQVISLRTTDVFKDHRCGILQLIHSTKEFRSVCGLLVVFFCLFFKLQDCLAVAKSTCVARGFCVPALLRPVSSHLLPGVFPEKRN